MKNNKLFLALSSLAAISLVLTGCGKKVELKDGENTAVSIKGTKITSNQYYDEIKEDNIATLIDMIDHKLLDKTYKTDDEEDKSVESQLSQMKKNYGSDEKTYKKILQQYFGVSSEEELEEMLRLEYKRNKAVKEYISDNLTDKEIKKYYEDNIYGEIKASHILISVDVDDKATDDEKKEAEEKALKKAKEVIKKLDNGKDFKKLAKEYSTDEATKEKGGDLGYFQPSDMVDEFSSAVRELKKGKYTTEPVKTKFGYHIILKVDEKEKAELKDVKSDIKEKLTAQKLQEDNSLYYQTLVKYREKQKITFKDDSLKKQYNEYMDKLIENSKSSN